jgi:activating signal cointegrator complex subunit 1
MPPRPTPPRLTHFLCLPLVTSTSRPQLQSSLATFRDAVTKSSTRELPDGIPGKAIRPLGTLHLTLGVMSLLTPERVDHALKVLNGINMSDILSVPEAGNTIDSSKSSGMSVVNSSVEKSHAVKESLRITLRGLESMHDSRKTSILYSSPVDLDQRLYNFSQKLRDIFTAADLLVVDSRPLLLHATIVNTVYVPGVRGKGSGHGKSRAKLTLDATELLEDYEDFLWMEGVALEKVAICRMGAKENVEGEEEYVIEGEIDVPSAALVE